LATYRRFEIAFLPPILQPLSSLSIHLRRSFIIIVYLPVHLVFKLLHSLTWSDAVLVEDTTNGHSGLRLTFTSSALYSRSLIVP